jgi:hypothetical protein
MRSDIRPEMKSEVIYSMEEVAVQIQ